MDQSLFSIWNFLLVVLVLAAIAALAIIGIRMLVRLSAREREAARVRGSKRDGR